MRELPLEQYLTPQVAVEVYNIIIGHDRRPEATTLSAKARSSLERSMEDIGTACPGWPELMSLPIVFMKSHAEGVIGYSNASIPQHAFLAERCWQSVLELKEQTLHETAHLWMYMLEELWPFAVVSAPPIYQLPSGVASKTATGVLHAAFVSAVLHRYYSSRTFPDNLERATEMHEYCDDCIAMLRDASELTPVGQQIVSIIGDAIH